MRLHAEAGHLLLHQPIIRPGQGTLPVSPALWSVVVQDAGGTRWYVFNHLSLVCPSLSCRLGSEENVYCILISAQHQQWHFHGWFLVYCFPGQIRLRIFACGQKRKTGELWENPRGKDENQRRNTTHTCGKARESNAGYGVERRAHYYCDFCSLKKAPFFSSFWYAGPLS